MVQTRLVRNTQIAFYQDGPDTGTEPDRAAGAGVDAGQVWIKQYRDGTPGSDVIGSAMTLQTWSYFKGVSGEEKLDFTQNYKENGITVRNTSQQKNATARQ